MTRPTIRRMSRAVAGPAIVLGAVAAVAVIATTPTTVGGTRSGAAFTACMRAHGLPGFPDVTFSSDGLVNLDIRGEKVDGSSRVYGAAVDACAPLLPAGSRLPGAPSAPSAPSAPDVTRS